MVTRERMRRRCVATQGCRNCQTSSKGGICPRCAFKSYFSNKKVQYCILSRYSSNFIEILFRQVDPSEWEGALASLLIEVKMRIKDPVRGCRGVIREIECELDRKREALKGLQRELASNKAELVRNCEEAELARKEAEFACEQADLTREGFVKFYEERNIPFIKDLTTCTDDEHWCLPYDSLWSW